MSKEIVLPPLVHDKLLPEAEEVLRVYHNGRKGNLVVCMFEKWPRLLKMGEELEDGTPESRNLKELAGWAMLMADLVGHVANYMQSKGVPVDEAIPQLLDLLALDLKGGQAVKGVIVEPGEPE